MKTTLYEISDLYTGFMNAVENGEIDDPEVITDTLDGIKEAFDDKVESIALLFKTISAEADAIETEAKALAARAKYKRSVCDRLKEYIATNMQNVGQTKLERAKVSLSFRKSEALEIIDDTALFNSLTTAGAGNLVSLEIQRKYDKTGIKKALKSGATFDGCALVTKDNLQIR